MAASWKFEWHELIGNWVQHHFLGYVTCLANYCQGRMGWGSYNGCKLKIWVAWIVRNMPAKTSKRGIFTNYLSKRGSFAIISGGGLFFYCKAPPTQAPPLCTWHVAQGGSAPDAGAFGSAQGSDTTGGAPAAGATASVGQPGACPPPSLFFSHPPVSFHTPHPKILYFLYCLSKI